MQNDTATAIRLPWTDEFHLKTAFVHDIGTGGLLRANIAVYSERYLRANGKAPGTRLGWVITSERNWFLNLAQGETEPGCLDWDAAKRAVEAALPLAEIRHREIEAEKARQEAEWELAA